MVIRKYWTIHGLITKWNKLLAVLPYPSDALIITPLSLQAIVWQSQRVLKNGIENWCFDEIWCDAHDGSNNIATNQSREGSSCRLTQGLN
mmetsp:Transcript_10053/g.17996  ORF Transcript_10053/g.17996 Transcript_10053/m.17996 type:complete len:90 (-) Transcript_10053:249-518(-)